MDGHGDSHGINTGLKNTGIEAFGLDPVFPIGSPKGPRSAHLGSIEEIEEVEEVEALAWRDIVESTSFYPAGALLTTALQSSHIADFWRAK